MPDRSTRRLLGALALCALMTACKSSGDAPKAEAPNADAPKAEAPGADTPPAEAPAPAAPPPKAGWTRIDLGQYGLKGTIDAPPGAAVAGSSADETDRDGLTVKIPQVQIGPRGCGVSVRAVAVPPPRLKSADAMARFHDRFEVEGTHTHGPDHWSVVQRWRPGECMAHGWSKPAGLICDVFKCPCDQMAQWVEVCGSLRAGDGPNAIETNAGQAFPDVDPAAAAVAMTVGRAVARDDAAMLKSTLGPAGLKIGAAQYTAEALGAALEGKAVMQVVAPLWAKTVGPDPGQLMWNGQGDGARVQVFFGPGYGEQPYFTVEKSGAAWHLVEFGVFDLGEP